MNDNGMTTDDLFDDDDEKIIDDTAGTGAGDGDGDGTDGDGDGTDGDETGGDAGDGTDGDGDGADGDGTDGDDKDASNLTGIERYLSDYGIVGGQISFEDGEKVAFNELDAEEQYNILQSLTSEARPSIEEEYDLDNTEVDLLNDIRNSGVDVATYINNLVNSNVQQTMAVRDSFDVDYTNMPDDAIFLRWLQETNENLSEEDALATLENQKANETLYKNQVSNLRGQYIQVQENTKKAENIEETRKRDEALEADRYEIVAAVENIDSIAGAQVSDGMKNEVLHSLLEVNDQGDPLIMEEMFSDPERLFKAAWFMKYGEGYLENVDKYWKRKESESYKRGRADVLNGAPESSKGMARNHVIPKPSKGAGGQGGQGKEPKSVDALWDD